MANRKKSRGELPHVPLPEWVDTDAWAGYLEMRLLINKPPTERALVLSLRTLEKLRAAGHDPNAVLDQSTQASWQGLFPLRAPRAGEGPAAQPAHTEADQQWALVRQAMRSDDPRRLTDHRTRFAVEQIGWSVLQSMQVNDVPHRARDFLRHFNAAPAAPRASIHQLPVRKVANG